jgi:hypothetical protein
MLEVFTEGGYPMWFLLAAALSLLAAAGDFAARPTRTRLDLTKALGLTTFLSIAMGIAADVSAVGHHASEYLAHHPAETLATVVLQGVGESMSPAVMGFSCLTLAAALVSVGLFRAGGEMA